MALVIKAYFIFPSIVNSPALTYDCIIGKITLSSKQNNKKKLINYLASVNKNLRWFKNV